MGANKHTTVTPDGGQEEPEETEFLVIGVNQYPDDGFEVFRVFDTEEEAEEYLEDKLYKLDGERSYREWSNHYYTEVPKGSDGIPRP